MKLRWEVWVCPKHGICRDDGDLLEGQDPEQANANDPDGWTGIFYCGYSHDSEGCYEEVEQIWVVPEQSDSKPFCGPESPTQRNPRDNASNGGRMAEASAERDPRDLRPPRFKRLVGMGPGPHIGTDDGGELC